MGSIPRDTIGGVPNMLIQTNGKVLYCGMINKYIKFLKSEQQANFRFANCAIFTVGAVCS